MRYRIDHRTHYTYRVPVYESFNEVRLQPLVCSTQAVLDFDLRIEPPATVIAFRDYYGNSVHDFGVAYLHDRLSIEATSDVVTYAEEDELLVPEVLSQPDASVSLRALASDDAAQDVFAEFLGPSPYVELDGDTEAIAREVCESSREQTTLQFLDAATEEVRRRLEYRIGTTTVHSAVSEVLGVGSGVCQDFAHVLIALCRHAGMPARYVSGYLGGAPPARASHAWVEAFVPPYGWLGVDVAHGTHCTGQHVKIGVGRDYSDVTVLRGTYKGDGRAELDVEVTSAALHSLEQTAAPDGDGVDLHGRLVSIQNLGAMRRYQQGAVLTQAMGGLRQTLGDDLPLPPPRIQSRAGEAVASQQPHQQQQGRR